MNTRDQKEKLLQKHLPKGTVLFAYQRHFYDTMLDRDAMWADAGIGKSYVLLLWLLDKQDTNPMVMCPKAIKRQWEKKLVDWQLHKTTVVTKEEYKNIPIKELVKYNTLAIDEAQYASAPLFIARDRSAIAEHVYNHVSQIPNVLLTTATPIMSKCANLHTQATFLGIDWEWKEYRAKYMELRSVPYIPRPAWLHKKGWQKAIAFDIPKTGRVVRMSEVVELPAVTEEVIDVPMTAEVKKRYLNLKHEVFESTALWVAEHRVEQECKVQYLKELSNKHAKILVVARYKKQIAELQKELEKIRPTFSVTGDTKNQGAVVEEAQKYPEVFLIMQASIGAGLDINGISVTVFVSQAWSSAHNIQMRGRTVRIHDLKPVKYTYLIGGKRDRAVYDRVLENESFSLKGVNFDTTLSDDPDTMY
jgi:SNF2 family DNA or RNA helicase